MPIQAFTNVVEDRIKSNSSWRAKAKSIIKEAPDKPTASTNLKFAVKTFVFNKSFQSVYNKQGQEVYKQDDSLIQGVLTFFLNNVDWDFLVNKYWDLLRVEVVVVNESVNTSESINNA